jgi:nitroreductase
MDLTTVDQLLTTTRSVRMRLDFSRPVEPEIIEKCIEIAVQAPTGSNAQGWNFMVVTDPTKRAQIAELYKKSWYIYSTERRQPTEAQASNPEQMSRVIRSARYLADHMHEVPILIIPCLQGRVDGAPAWTYPGFFGSILPAAWSLMLALHSRGLGSAWTSLHLRYEADAASILGIPPTITQAALLPVAYFTGEDFKAAKRLPAGKLTYWDSWGTTR